MCSFIYLHIHASVLPIVLGVRFRALGFTPCFLGAVGLRANLNPSTLSKPLPPPLWEPLPESCFKISGTSGLRGLELAVWDNMGGCQNYGPFFEYPLNIRCRTIIGNQKGTIILITTHIVFAVVCLDLCEGKKIPREWLQHTRCESWGTLFPIHFHNKLIWKQLAANHNYWAIRALTLALRP